MKKIVTIVFLSFLCCYVKAQMLSVVAGNGVASNTGDGGNATLSTITPSAVTLDAVGNLYAVAGLKIRKISTTGIISTYVDFALYFTSMGYSTYALQPTVVVDDTGNVYVSATFLTGMFNERSILKWSPIHGTSVYLDACQGSSMAIDTSNDIYITGGNNYPYLTNSANEVLKINHITRAVTIVAGMECCSAAWCCDGSPATNATLYQPNCVAVDRNKNLYISDFLHNRIRKVSSSTGIITTIAGNGTLSTGLTGVATSIGIECQNLSVNHAGEVIYSDGLGYQFYKLSGGMITHVIGAGFGPFSSGPALTAHINSIRQSFFDHNDQFYFPDETYRICKVCFNTTTPTISISASSISVCSGTTVNFTSSITNGGSTPIYQWFVNGSVVGSSSSYSYIPVNGDVVKCKFITSITCPSSDTVNSSPITMVVNPIITPSISISASSTSVCVGTIIHMSSTISGGGTAPIYRWYVNGILVGTLNSYSYVPTNGDVIKCRLTSNAICRTIDTIMSFIITISVIPLTIPSISISTPSTELCAGDNIDLTSVISGGGSSPLYQWIVNGVDVSSTYDFTYTPSDGDIIECMMVTNAICPSIDSVLSTPLSITVHSLPTIYNVTGSGSFVDSASVTLDNSEIGATYYLINSIVVDSLHGTGSVIHFNIVSSGNYHIYSESVYGCIDSMNDFAAIVILPDTSSSTAIINRDGSIIVFPNPFNKSINVGGHFDVINLKLYDMIGNKILEADSNIMNTEKLNCGIYMVIINDKIRRLVTKI